MEKSNQLPFMEGRSDSEGERQKKARTSKKSAEARRTVEYWVRLEQSCDRDRKATDSRIGLVESVMKKHNMSGAQLRAFLHWCYTSPDSWPVFMRERYGELSNWLRDQTIRDRLPDATGGAEGVERIVVRFGHVEQVWIDGELIEQRKAE